MGPQIVADQAAIGACLLTIIRAVQRGNPFSAVGSVLTILIMLLPPWSDFDE